jgi:ankyrin repeat protein
MLYTTGTFHNLNTDQYNAQINKYNKDGESPLILATKHGYDGIVRLLLSKGACTNLTDGNGNTALSFYATDAVSKFNNFVTYKLKQSLIVSK